MKYFDITRPISPDMVIYPGNPAVVFEQMQEASPTSSALTKITLGSHTGTHIDAPSHIQAGAANVDQYSLEQLNGSCEVIDLTSSENIITAADLPTIQAERVIFKTKNSAADPHVWDPNFVALDESAAQKLVDAGVRLVGLDAMSIKKKGVRDKVHQILLDAGIVVLEGLWLADIAPGDYQLMCLPLPVNLDGAPVRAVLTK